MSDVFAPQSSPDSRQFVQSANADGSLNFSQVDFDQLNFNGIFGPTVTSTTSNTVAIGTPTFTLDIDDGISFLVNDLVQAVSLDDTSCWMYGIITSKDTNASPAEITLLVFRTSNLTITSANWQLQVVGRNWGEAEQTGYSSTNLTIAAGSNTFTTQSGKYFPIQAPVRITDLTTPANQYFGTVVAYSGTTLIINIPSTSIFGSDSASSTWSIYCMGPPETRIGLYQQNGLLLATGVGGSTQATFTSGSVRDSSDTVDLVYSNPNLNAVDFSNSANVVTTQLAGTISSSGTTVTGSGTSFTTDFSTSGTLADLHNQRQSLNPLALDLTAPVIISTAAAASTVTSITNNTSLATADNLGAGAGTTYFRGGALGLFPVFGSSTFYVGIMLARKDADGSTALFMASFTKSGTVDLPSGYTYYRIIAALQVGTGHGQFTGTYVQYMAPNFSNIQGTASVSQGGTGATSLGTGLSNSGASLAVSLTVTSNTLTSDVNMTNTSNYFDGPSVSTGSGTWFAAGSLTITAAGGNVVLAKLWDGTKVLASTRAVLPTGAVNLPISLSGFRASPSGNIRLSANATTTSAKIAFNASGNSADSSVTCVRVG